MTGARMYDVPRIGEPFPLRGVRDVLLTLDEFAPTHLDAWYGRADLGGREVPAVVVRHAGDVMRHGLGRRRKAADLLPEDAPPDAVLGVVVEEDGVSLRWLPPGDPAAAARDLSRRDWRAFLD
jgi:hypothetical protein